jgi:hypothetical protein
VAEAEQVIQSGRRTFVIGLDALNPTDLKQLKKVGKPIIESLRLPQ